MATSSGAKVALQVLLLCGHTSIDGGKELKTETMPCPRVSKWGALRDIVHVFFRFIKTELNGRELTVLIDERVLMVGSSCSELSMHSTDSAERCGTESQVGDDRHDSVLQGAYTGRIGSRQQLAENVWLVCPWGVLEVPSGLAGSIHT